MEKENQMRLEIKPEIAKGDYSNLAVITHSQSEFILDFATMLPGLERPLVNDRIIMTPEHAKRLLNALSENVSKYEASFGPVSLGGEPRGTFNINDFKTGGTRS